MYRMACRATCVQQTYYRAQTRTEYFCLTITRYSTAEASVNIDFFIITVDVYYYIIVTRFYTGKPNCIYIYNSLTIR